MLLDVVDYDGAGAGLGSLLVVVDLWERRASPVLDEVPAKLAAELENKKKKTKKMDMK